MKLRENGSKSLVDRCLHGNLLPFGFGGGIVIPRRQESTGFWDYFPLKGNLRKRNRPPMLTADQCSDALRARIARAKGVPRQHLLNLASPLKQLPEATDALRIAAIKLQLKIAVETWERHAHAEGK